MSLFRYTILLQDGREKTSRVTAKTEDEARARVAQLNAIKEWRSFNQVTPSTKVATTGASSSTLSKLEKLLFLQSGKCFFCGMALERKEASIEHIYPRSKGGSNAGDNTVACCTKLNQVFGDMDIKEKLRIILSKAGSFTCPRL